MIKIIEIPTLNDGSKDFHKLFSIWKEIQNYSGTIKFNFSSCNFLRPNAVAFIGGLARLVESHNGQVSFDWDTLQEKIKTNLCQNGFAGKFAYPSTCWGGNSIPYREDPTRQVNEIMDYLEKNWLGRGWVHVSTKLRNAILGHMWEIYNNAFEHGKSTIGVFSCGQNYPYTDTLLLSVVDFGLGIPCKVRRFLKSDPRAKHLEDASCLQWAFQRGNTTKSKNEPGGLGLDLLKEFVQLNHGKLEVYSNGGYAIVDQEGERFENLPIPFKGTVVHITLHCDEALYHFEDESFS